MIQTKDYQGKAHRATAKTLLIYLKLLRSFFDFKKQPRISCQGVFEAGYCSQSRIKHWTVPRIAANFFTKRDATTVGAYCLDL
jgi:hypothetical protein